MITEKTKELISSIKKMDLIARINAQYGYAVKPAILFEAREELKLVEFSNN